MSAPVSYPVGGWINHIGANGRVIKHGDDVKPTTRVEHGVAAYSTSDGWVVVRFMATGELTSFRHHELEVFPV